MAHALLAAMPRETPRKDGAQKGECAPFHQRILSN
jgi:hypothetical protein